MSAAEGRRVAVKAGRRRRKRGKQVGGEDRKERGKEKRGEEENKGVA